jgi:hypothetical protein
MGGKKGKSNTPFNDIGAQEDDVVVTLLILIC